MHPIFDRKHLRRRSFQGAGCETLVLTGVVVVQTPSRAGNFRDWVRGNRILAMRNGNLSEAQLRNSRFLLLGFTPIWIQSEFQPLKVKILTESRPGSSRFLLRAGPAVQQGGDGGDEETEELVHRLELRVGL